MVKALLANSTLPKVVSGTSAGSIVAALAATHTDEELHAMYAVDMRCMTFDLFSNVHMGKLTWELVTKGAMHCHDHFKVGAGRWGCRDLVKVADWVRALIGGWVDGGGEVDFAVDRLGDRWIKL